MLQSFLHTLFIFDMNKVANISYQLNETAQANKDVLRLAKQLDIPSLQACLCVLYVSAYCLACERSLRPDIWVSNCQVKMSGSLLSFVAQLVRDLHRN